MKQETPENWPIIPAGAGWYVVDYQPRPCFDAPYEDKVYKIPVVAWRVGPEYAEPVCVDEPITKDYSVMGPDGQVICPLNRSFADLAGFVKHCDSKST